MQVETAPMKRMLTQPVGDICHSACQVACGPSMANASANSGSGGTRQSHGATNARPQITATRTARKTSKGFIDVALALLAGFRFPQQISAVQRRVIIGRDQREADVGQHTL